MFGCYWMEQSKDVDYNHLIDGAVEFKYVLMIFCRLRLFISDYKDVEISNCSSGFIYFPLQFYFCLTDFDIIKGVWILENSSLCHPLMPLFVRDNSLL